MCCVCTAKVYYLESFRDRKRADPGKMASNSFQRKLDLGLREDGCAIVTERKPRVVVKGSHLSLLINFVNSDTFFAGFILTKADKVYLESSVTYCICQRISYHLVSCFWLTGHFSLRQKLLSFFLDSTL